MLIMRIKSKPIEALIYMERYVNKGSPSGFTKKYTVSAGYAPDSDYEKFELPCYCFPESQIKIYNTNLYKKYKTQMCPSGAVLFPIHPDMVTVFVKQFSLFEFDKENVFTHIEVVPTANGRTVCTISEQKRYYIKLHYEGILGRIHRALPYKKAIAGPELSVILLREIDKGKTPNGLGILREDVALVKRCGDENKFEVGTVLRDFVPYPPRNDTILIPFFSLFSRDSKAIKDPFIICQMLDLLGKPLEYFQEIIQFILESYLYLVFDLGFIPEINAQNILLEVTTDWKPSRIIFRDLQGWEKDLTIRKNLGLNTLFESAPYKCISIDQRKEYYIRHSFSYDFKLGHYIFDELVSVVNQEYNYSRTFLTDIITNIFHSVADGREEDYFEPRSSWFSHDKILLTTERPYVEMKGPKYRR